MLELGPSANSKHFEAVPGYITKSQDGDLFQCNVQDKCSLARSVRLLIVHRCSARLCVPHLVAAGCSDFITEGKRGTE